MTTYPTPPALYSPVIKSVNQPTNSSLEESLAAVSVDQIAHPSLVSPLKRSLDVLGAIIGLAIMALIYLPIAIAIQLDSPGPVFYSQIRCGVKGRPFKIWKFRSMITDADQRKHLVQNEAKGLIFKSKDDPRITRSGKFLRRTSLDEFPQFWNVLKGDMSLVGTRPPTLDEVNKYQPHHWVRLNVKPGMTGEWQVNGRSNVIDFEDIVKMDVDYQRKWSTFYDVMLIIKTIGVVFNKQGAC